ncbi:hypothetical protein TNCT_579941 [Trichonephila clavata]|uniref:Uncharacterized protein n=1 Tax=Trichonephila clavata TaxID=2740835 RepID=A0A8X6HDY1_TRICU|nr:hypothetical protein TNCT_579941 [Trichonephila clavata]
MVMLKGEETAPTEFCFTLLLLPVSKSLAQTSGWCYHTNNKNEMFWMEWMMLQIRMRRSERKLQKHSHIPVYPLFLLVRFKGLEGFRAAVLNRQFLLIDI